MKLYRDIYVCPPLVVLKATFAVMNDFAEDPCNRGFCRRATDLKKTELSF